VNTQSVIDTTTSTKHLTPFLAGERIIAKLTRASRSDAQAQEIADHALAPPEVRA